MSRIGKNPVIIPQGVEISVSKDNVVTVKGPKGELTQNLGDGVSVEIEEGQLVVSRKSDSKDHRAKHGLYRSLIGNMIEGVSVGFKIQQELIGVGYRAKASGQELELALGYSHPIIIQLPAEVSAETLKGKAPMITLESHDKQLVGMIAAKIRSFRKPEPYKGKGVRFVGEHIRRKAGKAGAK